MAVNRVIVNNETILDLTGDTVTAAKLMEGYTAHDKSGALITGTASGSKPELVYAGTIDANTTSTSATLLATRTISKDLWTKDKVVIVSIRDQAGVRDGYHYGTDTYFYNYQLANGTTANVTASLKYAFNRSASGQWSLYAGGATEGGGYGVFASKITSAGAVSFRARYNASITGTINGRYNIEIYLADYQAGNPFDTSIAYAVLDANGVLTFFRSENEYSAGTGQTVTDVDGNTYTGEVFTGIETETGTTAASVPWDARRSAITKVVSMPSQPIVPLTLEYWFYNCANATEIDLSGFDTKYVTSMSRICHTCSKATTINVSGFDTRNVTNMYAAFTNCSKLESIDVTSFDTSNVTNFGYMFSSSQSLTSLDLRSFDTSKGTNFSYMFRSLSKLTTIYANDWYDSSRSPNSSNMFNGCTSLPGFSSSSLTWEKARVVPNGYFTSPN